MGATMVYCPTCKKFNRVKGFSESSYRCRVCGIQFPVKYRKSWKYYEKIKKRDDFEELEKNYEKMLEEEATKQQKIMDDLKTISDNISSTDSLPGKTIVNSLGVVSGTDSYSAGGVFGEGYSSKWGDIYMNAAIKKATDKMINIAYQKGANAIVSLKTATSQAAMNTIVVTVTGTAVVVEEGENLLQEKAVESDALSSSADEILKFKKLLDEGIITQEEFDAKKKQLLGL